MENNQNWVFWKHYQHQQLQLLWTRHIRFHTPASNQRSCCKWFESIWRWFAEDYFVIFSLKLQKSTEPDRFFKGCVRNLNLNDHQGPVSLKEDPLKASEGILSVQTFGYVQHQCIRDDICSSKPCNEDNGGGRCEDLWNAYKCNCNSGWVGDKCSQTSRSCNSTFCQNSYDCENLENDYKCLCNAGYQGKYCNVSITFCQENPCKNNATCDETNKKLVFYCFFCVQ